MVWCNWLGGYASLVPVLAESPHGHLVSPSQGEEGSGQTLNGASEHKANKFYACYLGHYSEADPGPNLIGVVGAGAEVEEASQGV